MDNVLNYISNNILLFDGAMGTMLKEKGWDMRYSSETLNMTNEKMVEEIHKEYILAGAKVITTNTFMCNTINEEVYNYKLEEVLEKGVEIANKAKGKNKVFIALDVGPSGEFFKRGNKDLNRVYDNYSRISKKSNELCIDLIFLETITDLQEIEIALKAIRDYTNIPVFCTMSTWGGTEKFSGFTIKEMCKAIEVGGANVLGINCSSAPKNLYKVVDELVLYSKLPIMVKPNVGTNKCEEIDEFCNNISDFIKKGVRVIGGCCGTSPKYIEEMKVKL